MEHTLHLEQEAIEHMQEMHEEDGNTETNKSSKKQNEETRSQSAVQEVSVSIEVPQEDQQETSPLIYGRSLKLKEQLVKVIDLSVDSGKVQLDGEILNIDSRELKNGKVLVMFDLFDGSSTITCKLFSPPDKSKA